MNNKSPELPPTTHHEQVSGTSIFWALTSLALSAMIQPSFCGYVLSGNTSSAALSPHRSSPFVCLVDAGVDLWTIRRHLRRGKDQQPRDLDDGTDRVPARPTAATAQLALLVLGALPPALKIFGTSGIPRSQLLGAVFFTSTVTSAARTLLTGAPSQQELTDITKELGARSESGRRLALCTREEMFQPTMLPHTYCLLLAWSQIGGQIDISVPERVSNTIETIGVCVCWTFCAHAAQHTLFIVVRGRWILPCFPLVAMTAAALLLMFYDDLSTPRADRHAAYSAFNPFALVLLGHAALCSFTLASLLRRSMQRLHGMFMRLPDTGTGSTSRVQPRHEDMYNSTSPPPGARGLELADVGHAGDIGLAALSRCSENITANVTSVNAPAEPTPPSPDALTRRWRLKTEGEAKQELSHVSRAIHGIVSPGTEDTAGWEQHRAQCEEEGRSPYAGPAPAGPPPPLWKRLAADALFHVIIVIYRLGLTVYTAYGHFSGTVWFHLVEPWQGETGWLGFAMLNVSTAASYYFTAFEAEGTVEPGWTQALG